MQRVILRFQIRVITAFENPANAGFFIFQI